MADMVGSASRSAAIPAAPTRERGSSTRRTIVLAGGTLMVAAVLAMATLMQLSTKPVAFSGADVARAHVLWLSDEHAVASRRSGPAAHVRWVRDEKASYAGTGFSSPATAWQAYHGFRLEEEGYGR